MYAACFALCASRQSRPCARLTKTVTRLASERKTHTLPSTSIHLKCVGMVHVCMPCSTAVSSVLSCPASLRGFYPCLAPSLQSAFLTQRGHRGLGLLLAKDTIHLCLPVVGRVVVSKARREGGRVADSYGTKRRCLWRRPI
jgi:hypothetical protein